MFNKEPDFRVSERKPDLVTHINHSRKEIKVKRFNCYIKYSTQHEEHNSFKDLTTNINLFLIPITFKTRVFMTTEAMLLFK